MACYNVPITMGLKHNWCQLPSGQGFPGKSTPMLDLRFLTFVDLVMYIVRTIHFRYFR